MKTPEEIAQWVINNRYPQNEKQKVSDAEMYNNLVDSIANLCNLPVVSNRREQFVSFLKFYRGDNLNKDDIATVDMYLDRNK